MLWYVLAALVTLYLVVFFVLAPRIIPFMRKQSLPTRIPQSFQDAIDQIERDANTPYEFIKGCSHYLLSGASGGRVITLLRLDLAFETDTKKLLARRGFMHCHHLNHLLRIMLAKSKFFSDEDIRLRRTFLNFNLHQYVQVCVAGQWYDVDLAADHMGVPLGKHAWLFR